MPERKLLYVNAEKAPTLYVNSVQVALSPFDLRLRLGVVQQANKEQVVTDVVATVFMSPQHAKVFARILADNLAKYEGAHGTVAVPEDHTPEEPELGDGSDNEAGSKTS